MLPVRPATKILVDGGDPDETLRVRNLLGFVDGQTTNPTFVAKNPDVQNVIASGRKLTSEEQKEEYKRLFERSLRSLGLLASPSRFSLTSIPVRANAGPGGRDVRLDPQCLYQVSLHPRGTPSSEDVSRAGYPGEYDPVLFAGAAAVYAATKGTKEPVYVSPFVGRLDDRGEDGMGVVENIKEMYQNGDGHVHVLAASFRKLDHLLYSIALGAELATSPAEILEQWAAAGFPLPDRNFRYQAVDKDGNALRPIPYKQLDLNASWESFDLKHELTDKGIKRFVDDYKSTLKGRQDPAHARLWLRSVLVKGIDEKRLAHFGSGAGKLTQH